MVKMPSHVESPFNSCAFLPTKGVAVSPYKSPQVNCAVVWREFVGFCQSCRNRATIMFLITVLCQAVPATASLVEITFVSPGALAQGGFYVGPYNFTVDSQSKSLVCDDFIDHITAGESWNANVYTFSDLSQAKFAPAGLQSYGEAAWLYEEGLLHTNAWSDIQYAIWAVFNPDPVKASSGWTTGSSNWLATSQQQAFTANEFHGIKFYTPTQLTNGPQELIGGTIGIPPIGLFAVPEVKFPLLVGAVLMLVLWLRWRYVKHLTTNPIAPVMRLN